jgi:hypothetical protein
MQSDTKSVLPSFQNHFVGTNFKKGTEVRLALANDGSVASFVDGTKARPHLLACAAICQL